MKKEYFSVRDIGDVSHLGKNPFDESRAYTHFMGFPTTMIASGANAHIQSCTQVPFRPTRLVVSPATDDMIVTDIRIGRKSFLTAANPLPASAFPGLPDTPELREIASQLEHLLRVNVGSIDPGSIVTLTVANKSEKPLTFNAMFCGELP